MAKKHRDYDSTTPDPTRPEKNDHSIRREDPDKTRKKEKNDPTRESDPDISSTPDNRRDEDEDRPEGSWLNRTEV